MYMVNLNPPSTTATVPKAGAVARRATSRRSTPVSDMDTELVERMAQRTVLYLNSFNDHSRAIRGRDKNTIVDAYDKVTKNDVLLPFGTPRKKISEAEVAGLEQRLHAPAHTIYDHVLTSLIAHGLLLCHLDAIRSLSPDTANRIDARTQELKKLDGERKPLPKNRFRPLVPPPPLPTLDRPTSSVPVTPLNETLVEEMLATPTALIGKTFFFEAADLYYRVVAIEFTMNASVFKLQYDGTSCVADDVSETTMREMLTGSAEVQN